MSSTTLRDQRTAVTRDAILGALAALVTEDGVHDVAVQDVADRAGVSHRTVYRHYPTKEALLEGLSDWVGERMEAEGGVMSAGTLSEVPDAIRRNFGLFDRYADVVEALVRLQVGGAVASEARQRRSRDFGELVRPSTACAPEVRDGVAALVRQLASSRTWFGLREDHELDGELAGEVTAWAVEVLAAAIEAGHVPGTSGEARA